MIDITLLLDIAQEAGRRILDIYHKGATVTLKSDDSPLTQADLASHQYICSSLAAHFPDIPVLSEESPPAQMQQRRSWERYWLIDPLDGTKEFIKRNGEFTVNIALIDRGKPVLGVVHAPALERTFWGISGEGAFMRQGSAKTQPIQVASQPTNGRWRVVGSRSHQTPEFTEFMQRLPDAEIVSMGSSLKLCLVACAEADLYPRLGPTCEWDTAAAQAVVEAAGGQVLTWPGLTPLTYNSNPDSLLNPHFIVCARRDPAWELERQAPVYEHKIHDSKAEVVWHRTQVDKHMRARALSQKPCCIWLTGLSGSGKSTIANALELALHQAGYKTYLLDGDNVRQGLNKDLGMSESDRAENIRRVGETARLMVDAGLVVITAFISPFRRDRDQARALFEDGEFIEVLVSAPLQECERRDPKGLYQKARAGKLKDFTGIDSPYEAPENPEVVVETVRESVDGCVQRIIHRLDRA